MLEKGFCTTSKTICCGDERASWRIWSLISVGRFGNRVKVSGTLEFVVE